MAIELHIDDGNPWYLSPDIWVVPGTDPEGPPGQPVAGEQAYVWAQIHNRGNTAVGNATANFYWADPSVAISRTSAHLIGAAGVALDAGESQDVLCLTAWDPPSGGNGHFCLVVEVFAPSDPLPPHTALTPFDPPGDRHIAQRNINILQVSPQLQLVLLPFLAGTRWRRFDSRVVVTRQPLKLLGRGLAEHIGLADVREADTEFKLGVGLDDKGREPVPIQATEYILAAGAHRQLTVSVLLEGRLESGTAILVTAEELGPGGEVLGGVGTVIVASEAKRDYEKGE